MRGQAVVTCSGSRQTRQYGALSNYYLIDDSGKGSVGGLDAYPDDFCEISKAFAWSFEGFACDSWAEPSMEVVCDVSMVRMFCPRPLFLPWRFGFLLA